MELLVKLLTSTAKIPTKAHESDAGFDLYSDESVLIAPGATVKVKTGVAMMPVCSENVAGLIWDRSSMGAKGIHKLAGVIDQTYTGEIGIVLTNLNTNKFLYSFLNIINFLVGRALYPLKGRITEIINDLQQNQSYEIKAGDKIAQIIYQPVLSGPIRVVDDLVGERGEKGFGSSGS